MRRAAMAKDFSWADSALAYGALYRKLGEARRAEAKSATEAPAPRPATKRAAPRVIDEDFTAAASRADARALQRLAAAAMTIRRRTPRG
jgi:hypothetical protein